MKVWWIYVSEWSLYASMEFTYFMSKTDELVMGIKFLTKPLK